MEEDAERFRKAVAEDGQRVGRAEVVMTMTLRYEADVDLPTLAAEVGHAAGAIAAASGRFGERWRATSAL